MAEQRRISMASNLNFLLLKLVLKEIVDALRERDARD